METKTVRGMQLEKSLEKSHSIVLITRNKNFSIAIITIYGYGKIGLQKCRFDVSILKMVIFARSPRTEFQMFLHGTFTRLLCIPFRQYVCIWLSILWQHVHYQGGNWFRPFHHFGRLALQLEVPENAAFSKFAFFLLLCMSFVPYHLPFYIFN